MSEAEAHKQLIQLDEALTERLDDIAAEERAKTVKQTEIKRRATGKPFEKGNPGGPGREKGSKNRYTLLKEQILGAVAGAAGNKGITTDEYVASLCEKDSINFLRIAAGLIPKESKVDVTQRTVDAFGKELARMTEEELFRMARAVGEKQTKEQEHE